MSKLVDDPGGAFPRLFRPADLASLAFFRVAFGATMLWEVFRYFEKGWIAKYWIDPPFHFNYRFFEWVEPWPGNGMVVHFVALGVLAACITVGFAYRLSAALFFLGFLYTFLLEQARYLNHFYLVCLVSFLMIFLPAHRCFSIDARLRPKLRSQAAPCWALWLLRAQVGIPYFYGGLAKLNGDWLRGEPMRDWLFSRQHFPVIGRFFERDWMVYAFSYGGLLIDLLAVPFLLIARTRVVAFVFLLLFHWTNARLFGIGIFPWVMILMTTIFFPPDWPRRVFADVWGRPNRRGVAALGGVLVGALTSVWLGDAAESIPVLAGAVGGALVAWTLAARLGEGPVAPPVPHDPALEPPRLRAWIVGGLGLWMAVQILLPLRHYLVPGNVHWTEEGHRFAWHMKLRDKEGEARFIASNPANGATEVVDPRKELTSWQSRKMSTRPYMIHRYARHIARTRLERGWADVEVRADVRVSLNGRPKQRLIDPTADLAAQPLHLIHNAWILPLTTPLKAEDEED